MDLLPSLISSVLTFGYFQVFRYFDTNDLLLYILKHHVHFDSKSKCSGYNVIGQMRDGYITQYFYAVVMFI